MGCEVEVTLKLKLAHPVSKIGRRYLRSHIEVAVENWGGGYHPSDILFDGIESVAAGPVRKI